VIKFPHANGHQVPLADFLEAWRITVNNYGPGGDAMGSLQVALPRLNAKTMPMCYYLQSGKEFSLEYMCRNLVPNGYRNTMQASRIFMRENSSVLEETRVLNPVTGREVNGARLLEGVINDNEPHSMVDALFEADCDDLEVEDGGETPERLVGVEAVSRPEYDGYVERLVHMIHSEPYTPVFRGRPIGGAVQGWSNRLQTYFWPSPKTNHLAVASEVAQLEAEAARLALLLPNWTAADEAAAITLANNIFAWGGVPQKQATVTPANLRAVFNAAIDGVVANGEPLPPMNSGWTKVAAFASAHLEAIPNACPQVIWDSRVATAVTSRLEQLFLDDGLDAVPACFSDIGPVKVGRGGTRPRTLLLSWRDGYKSWLAQYGGSRLLATIRNKLNSNAALYGRMPSNNGLGNWTSRGVEMVLFMDGY